MLFSYLCFLQLCAVSGVFLLKSAHLFWEREGNDLFNAFLSSDVASTVSRRCKEKVTPETLDFIGLLFCTYIFKNSFPVSYWAPTDAVLHISLNRLIWAPTNPFIKLKNLFVRKIVNVLYLCIPNILVQDSFFFRSTFSSCQVTALLCHTFSLSHVEFVFFSDNQVRQRVSDYSLIHGVWK